MNRTLRAAGCAALLFATAAGHAQQVSVREPWVRAVPPQSSATGAFMQLTATEDARLVAAASPVAGVVEIHEMKMDGGVMRMRAVAGLDLPAGRSVALEPGGYHVMLMMLKQPLKDGDKVPITLTVEGKGGKRTTVDVQATVRPLAAPAHPPAKP